jgi:glycosyltransferase involved in cell wall biosynthesis
MSNAKTPMLSVLIPVRDGERYLAACLRSVLDENMSPIEILVVDDGSTDRSAEIAESFGPPVRCIRRPRAGQAAARNAAVAAAAGDLHFHFDADDLLLPGAITTLVGVLEGDPSVDLVTGRFETFLSPDAPLEVRERTKIPEGARRGHLSGVTVVRATAFARVGPIDESMPTLSSLDWYTRAIDAGLAIRVAPDVVMRRRIHGANTSLVHRNEPSPRMRLLKAVLDRRRASGQEPKS